MDAFTLAYKELERERIADDNMDAVIDRAKIIRDFMIKHRGKIERICQGEAYKKDVNGRIRLIGQQRG